MRCCAGPRTILLAAAVVALTMPFDTDACDQPVKVKAPVTLLFLRGVGRRETQTARGGSHERSFAKERGGEMMRFVKSDLKAHSLVLGSESGFSPWPVQAMLDVVDAHAYWQHPHFPHRQWDANDWIVKNV